MTYGRSGLRTRPGRATITTNRTGPSTERISDMVSLTTDRSTTETTGITDKGSLSNANLRSSTKATLGCRKAPCDKKFDNSQNGLEHSSNSGSATQVDGGPETGHAASNPKPVGEVVDMFCGIGGISHGFRQACFDVRAGYDIDASCRFGYETNNAAQFIGMNIEDVTVADVRSHFSGKLPTVLVGCAPCQPFSAYRKGKSDNRWCLLEKFAELAVQVGTDFVTMENVPGVVDYRDGKVFEKFIGMLSDAYPFVTHEIVDCSEHGVPQRRRRLVVIGSKTSRLQLLKEDRSVDISVANVIGKLPPIPAGGVCINDPLHRSSRLSELNLQRIRHSNPGGSWRNWPEDLMANCHLRKKGQGYRSVYGRLDWNKPAPTITTQCYGFGNGRFGHPEQDRAISLREAALLQSFPSLYRFFPEGEFPGFKTVGRWIGNAVPVALANRIAKLISGEILSNA